MTLRRLLIPLALVTGCASGRTEPGEIEPSAGPLMMIAAREGTDVAVPIRILTARSVALQFDLEFDADVLVLKDGNASPAVERVGKQLTVARRGKGIARVVVFGANLDLLPSGDLGEIHFRAITNKEQTIIRAVRLYASNAEGRDLATTVRDGQIVVQER